MNPQRPQSPPIKLEPEDLPAFAAPPAGFDQPKAGIPQGRIEEAEYESASVGGRRRLMVYIPPGVGPEQKLPVLYLLHGIGGTESEWADNGAPGAILDRLLDEGRIVPMLVVMPNGRARKDDRAEGNVFASAPAFGEFDKDLFGSVIPFIEANFPAKTGKADRALAGLSMGGGQSLNFGLGRPDLFDWVGGFSSAPNTFSPDALAARSGELKAMRLIWISCGDQDGLMRISQGVHRKLKAEGISHVWHVSTGGHTWPVWKSDLYQFSQLLFRPAGE